MNNGIVTALSKSASHTFNKYNCDSLTLLQGLGVKGDAHMGKTVKHRSRVANDPTQPNLRQVHLIQGELHQELNTKGYLITPGQMGENITTINIDLLKLPKGTLLEIGNNVTLEVTGLRNPCNQLDSIKKGLMKAVLDKDKNGNLIRKSGIMSVVIQGGDIYVGDTIKVKLPPKPHEKLKKV